jgi:hypothetical protein
MKRFSFFISCITLVALVGCSQETSLPNPTGKGSIRAINAIPTSPGITFLIDERLLGDVQYKASSNTQRYDDFSYVFNFEALFPEQILRTRIASQPLDVVADQEYTFVITGELANPDITIWESELRSWETTETVFLGQFGHTAESLGALDIYFDPPGVDPVPGAKIGTIQFTEHIPAQEFENGEYVLTIATAAGAATVLDPATIVYQSNALFIAERTSNLFSILDGDPNDVAPYTVRAFDVPGTSLSVPDARYQPTLQFVQASMALLPADIYDDEALTSRIVSNHLYSDVTADTSLARGVALLTYTAVDNVSVPLYVAETFVLDGAHSRFVVFGGDVEALNSVGFRPDRRPVETFAKFEIMNASANYPSIDAYLVEGDIGITDIFPRLLGLPLGAPPVTVTLDAASYDLYITSFGDKAILAGPIPVEAGLGDIFDTIVIDTADGTSVEVLFIPSQ